ncbi:exosortase H-associated membrane protein [Pseudohaliea sp.]|uniref:exosortase H-associated membrane protein n=1 Tax=Pseudohaliea sp. TaxID=2740289 RepID=UPI0032EDFC7C
MTPLGFFGRVLLLLVPAFAAWYLLGAVLAAPAVWLVSEILPAWLPALVASVYLDGATMTVVSSLGEAGGSFLPAEQAGGALGFRIDSRVLSYSMPFFAALHFATPLPGRWERFARGLFVLWLLLVPGLISTALKDLMLTLGESFLAAPGTPPADAVALAYQFNTLMVPPLAPILLWGWEARRSPAIQALFPALFPATPEADGVAGHDDKAPGTPSRRSPLER